MGKVELGFVGGEHMKKWMDRMRRRNRIDSSRNLISSFSEINQDEKVGGGRRGGETCNT